MGGVVGDCLPVREKFQILQNLSYADGVSGLVVLYILLWFVFWFPTSINLIIVLRITLILHAPTPWSNFRFLHSSNGHWFDFVH